MPISPEDRSRYRSAPHNEQVFPNNPLSSKYGPARALLAVRNGEPIPEKLEEYILSCAAPDVKSTIELELQIWNQIVRNKELNPEKLNLFRPLTYQTLLACLALDHTRIRELSELNMANLTLAVDHLALQKATFG